MSDLSDLVLGIDVGTSGVRVAAIDQAGAAT
jgi:sugar (pentulose or hexulose) kinase